MRTSQFDGLLAYVTVFTRNASLTGRNCLSHVSSNYCPCNIGCHSDFCLQTYPKITSDRSLLYALTYSCPYPLLLPVIISTVWLHNASYGLITPTNYTAGDSGWWCGCRVWFVSAELYLGWSTSLWPWIEVRDSVILCIFWQGTHTEKQVGKYPIRKARQQHRECSNTWMQLL